MLSLVLGQVLGLSPLVVVPLGLAEGICLTMIVATLAERFLFPMPRD